MERNTIIDKKKIITKTYNDFLKLLTTEEQLHAKGCIQAAMDQMVSGTFQIVVMGEIKKGKSSFISALLGEYNLLPTDSDVATSTVYKIKYGSERKYTVTFNSESSDQQDKEITQKQLPEYGTEKGNPGNKKQVAFIQVEIPNALLEQGLVIVDTPGVGGLFKKHKGITFEYAPYSDAVFFVVDSVDTVINEQEVKFLTDLYKITDQVFFVQTKIDVVDSDLWQSWKERNIDILVNSEELKEFNLTREKLQYFTVSSKLKEFADEDADQEEALEDLEDSGFVQLNEFVFNQLIAVQNGILIDRALNQLIEEVLHSEVHAIDRLGNVKENNKQKKDDKKREIEDILLKLEKWQDGSWRDVANDFSYQLSQETMAAKIKIHDALSPEQQSFENKIIAIKKQYHSVSELIEQNDEIISNYIASCAETGKNIVVQYLADVEKCFYEVSQQSLSDLKKITQLGDVSMSKTPLDITDSFSYTGAAVDGVAGSVVGGAVAGGMWWAMVGGTQAALIVGPSGGLLIGTAVALGPLGWAAIGAVGLLGAAGAAWGTNKMRENKKLNAAIVQLSNYMEEISLKSINNFNTNIAKIEKKIMAGSTAMFGTVESQSRQEIEAMLADLKKAQQLSGEEAAKEVEIRQSHLDNVRELLAQLTSISSQVA